MRIFLEEFTRRLPHMELMDQTFTFLPNTSFRGPEHLWVRWDPARNPERQDPAALEPRAHFEVGAPQVRNLARTLTVADCAPLAEDVLRLSLADPDGRPLPDWTPGAHLDLLFDDYERSYSLCGDPDRKDRFDLAVLREADGRGGSAHIHERFAAGQTVRVRGPKNHFPLDESASEYVLIAGGIGITPILAMADRLKRLGKPYALHYAGRSRASMAFLDRIERDHGAALYLYPKDEGRRLDLPAVVGSPRAGRQVYACGPERLLDALTDLCADWPEGLLHMEHFSAGAAALDPEKEEAFEAELADSGFTLTVPPDKTLLQVLREAGVDAASDCEEGLCGTCEVPVVAGDPDHRDKVLSQAERAENTRMMACCSRASGKVKLAL